MTADSVAAGLLVVAGAVVVDADETVVAAVAESVAAVGVAAAAVVEAVAAVGVAAAVVVEAVEADAAAVVEADAAAAAVGFEAVARFETAVDIAADATAVAEFAAAAATAVAEVVAAATAAAVAAGYQRNGDPEPENSGWEPSSNYCHHIAGPLAFEVKLFPKTVPPGGLNPTYSTCLPNTPGLLLLLLLPSKPALKMSQSQLISLQHSEKHRFFS